MVAQMREEHVCLQLARVAAHVEHQAAGAREIVEGLRELLVGDAIEIHIEDAGIDLLDGGRPGLVHLLAVRNARARHGRVLAAGTLDLELQRSRDGTAAELIDG